MLNSSEFEKFQQYMFKVLLFLSSYVPLSIIIFIKNIENYQLAFWILVLFIVIPLIIIRMYINIPIKRGQPNRDIKIIKCNGMENEMLNYISGYIIPFIAFNSDVITKEGIDTKELLIVIILFSVIGYLYMKANMYHINPIISIFYDIYLVNTEIEEGVILLVDKGAEIEINRKVFVRRISPGTLLLTNNKCRISKSKILVLLGFLFILLLIWNEELRKIIITVLNRFIKL